MARPFSPEIFSKLTAPRPGLWVDGLRRALHDLLLWHERTRERRALGQLDDHLLGDIGKSRAEALREARKPFWRD